MPEGSTQRQEYARAKVLFAKRCKSCRKNKYHHLYEVTDVTGSMVGKIEVGAIVGEHRSHGQEHMWEIFNFKKHEFTGSFSGRYIGRVLINA